MTKQGILLFGSLLSLLTTGCEHIDSPNKPIPEGFTVRRPDGSSVTKSDLQGKPWVISLWVPGCHLCAGELPDIDGLRAKYENQGVGFLSISVEPSREPNSRFMEQLGVKIPWTMAQGELLGPLAVKKLPSTIFVDKNGLILRAASGPRSVRALEREVLALLEK